jgi:hypothetical protein
VIPPPPLDERGRLRVGSTLILANLRGGAVGVCVVCTELVWRWWDLTLCDMPPVVDRDGQLTDQVALHPRCVVALLDYWWSMLHEDSGDEGPDAPDAPATPVAGVRRPQAESGRRAPTGAYAR